MKWALLNLVGKRDIIIVKNIILSYDYSIILLYYIIKLYYSYIVLYYNYNIMLYCIILKQVLLHIYI